MTVFAVGFAIWLGTSLTHLLMPIQGLKPADLHDTFNEVHNGHPHEAIDIAAARGTPVRAAVSGTIRKLFLSKAGGNTIYQFDAETEYCYYYAHLDRYADGLREGTQVRRGDVIGYVGSTGNADARTPHLHFAVFALGANKEWWKGRAINPYGNLMQAAKNDW